MTQQYTEVPWQDETTSQQGTLINAERLNQMQQAHHYADGLEEVDAVPTADPGVGYHKIVYCTADSTIYRWDGTQWTADIDDETKALLQQEIARATQAESTLRGQLEDEHDARVDAEAAINDRITDEATELAQRIATEASTRYSADTALGTRITNETSARETADTGLGNRITAEATARADADTALGGRIDTEQARAEAAEQANAQAIANTYTKAEIDTALGAKADTATTYSKTETDALLALKADQATTYTKAETDTLLASKANDNAVVHKAGDEEITGVKTYTYSAIGTNPARADLGRIRIKASNVDITNNPHGVEAPSIQWLDSANHICGVINTEYEADGSSQVILGPRRANGNLSWFIMNPDYMAVPTPGTGAPNNAVATLATLDGYLPMVRTTGNQDKSGIMRYLTGYTGSAYPVCDKTPENVSGKYLPLFKLLKQSSMIELTIKTSSEWMDAMMDVRTSLVRIRTEKHGNDRLANTDIIVMADATTYYVYMKYPQNRKLFVELSAYAPLFANGTENLTNLDFTFFSRTLVDEPQIGDVYTDKYISQAI